MENEEWDDDEDLEENIEPDDEPLMAELPSGWRVDPAHPEEGIIHHSPSERIEILENHSGVSLALTRFGRNNRELLAFPLHRELIPMVRILSVVVLFAWALPTLAQPSSSDDVQLLPGIDQEILTRLSAQLQTRQQQSDTIDKFSQLWNNQDGEGIKQLYDEIQSSPEGRRMLQDLIQQKQQQDPETVAKLKQLYDANRERFQGGPGRFPSRPPAEMQLPHRSRRNPDWPDRPRFRNDAPRPENGQPGEAGGNLPNPNESPDSPPFSLPEQPRTESSQSGPPANSAKAKQVQAVTRFFEKNFGPLDNSPAIRGLIRDIFMSEKLDPSGGGFDNLAQGNTGNLFENIPPTLAKSISNSVAWTSARSTCLGSTDSAVPAVQAVPRDGRRIRLTTSSAAIRGGRSASLWPCW